MERNKPEKKKRGKVYAFLSDKYIMTWVKMIKEKELVTNLIKTHHPHFSTQEPYFGDVLGRTVAVLLILRDISRKIMSFSMSYIT